MNLAFFNAHKSLNELKKEIIGIFKIVDSDGTFRYELIVDLDDNTVDTLNITQFGAIQQTHGCPRSFGIVKLFPNNQNMCEILLNPFEFNEFINSFNE